MTRAEKETFVKQVELKKSFSNLSVLWKEQYKDERLKYVASTNICWVEREKTKVWKDQASRSWIYTVKDILILGLAIAIVLSK